MIKARRQEKLVFKGPLRVDRDNFLEASVPVERFDQDILILGSKARNRAMAGDAVYVELLPESMWQCKSGVFLDVDVPADKVYEATEKAESLLESKPEDMSDKQPTGKIVGIADRHSFRRYVVPHLHLT